MKLLEDHAPGAVCFVHIPRTAGRSICEATGLTQSHEPWFKRRPITSGNAEYSFTVLRNPWDQIESWYVAANIHAMQGMELCEWIVRGYPGLRDEAAKDAWFNTVHPFDQLGRAGENLDDYFAFECIDEWWPKLSAIVLPHRGATLRSEERGCRWNLDAVETVALENEELIEWGAYEEPTEVWDV